MADEKIEVPVTSSRTLLWVVLGALLLGGAALGLRALSPTATTAAAPIPAEPRTEEPAQPAHAPPPPPPAPVSGADQPTNSAAAKNVTEKTSGLANPCEGQCKGTSDGAFQTALRAAAVQARACYQHALRQNSALSGKLTVALRVLPTGKACSAQAVESTLNDPGAVACILQKFRALTYPAPRGGCVDAAVPLNFVAAP